MSLPFNNNFGYQPYVQNSYQKPDQREGPHIGQGGLINNQPTLNRPGHVQIPHFLHSGVPPESPFVQGAEEMNPVFYQQLQQQPPLQLQVAGNQHFHTQQQYPQTHQHHHTQQATGHLFQGSGFQPMPSDPQRMLFIPNIQWPYEQQQQQQQQQLYPSGPIGQTQNPYHLYMGTLHYSQPYFASHPAIHPRHASFNVISNGHRSLLLIMTSQPRVNSEPTMPSMAASRIRTNSNAGHYKPLQTKRNAKPRINELSGIENKKQQYLSKEVSPIEYGELSLDYLNKHFQAALNITVPSTVEGDNRFELLLSNELEFELLDLYIHKLSEFLDIFWPLEIFQKVIPSLAVYDDTKMLLYSVLYFSSIILHRISPERIEQSIPVNYYQQCIKMIRYNLSSSEVADVNEAMISRCLLSTTMLCVSELSLIGVDGTHVQGVYSIFSSLLERSTQSHSLLKSSPFYELCFWAVYKCDQLLSFKLNLPLYSSVEKYWRKLDPKYFELFDNFASVDLDDETFSKEKTFWWKKKFLILGSQINDFKYSEEVLTEDESNGLFQKWSTLKSSLDEAEARLPISLKPIIYKPASNENVFPVTFFIDEIIVAIALSIKIAKLHLYESLLRRLDNKSPKVQEQLALYPSNFEKKIAKDIIGMIKTYESNIGVMTAGAYALRKVTCYIVDEPVPFAEVESLVDKVIELCHLR
ncbi:uncharacterized protein PRCAT00005853001 [Priceomyces carsonii]|uniref:uncharacterized protein n=1 Tax=Priceomyces carsonii TaxID=28549 RepID=UPI002EDA33C2|nr:unnamed protein product [Priceomyces carsonii]